MPAASSRSGLPGVIRGGTSPLHFIETDVFTRRIIALGLEAALKDFQGELIANPLAGGLDPGTGGLRKVRMPDPGRQQGKRGGVRVHYIFLPAHQVVYLVFVYGKDEQSTLGPRQKRQLKAVVEGIKAEWREPRGHRKRGP